MGENNNRKLKIELLTGLLIKAGNIINPLRMAEYLVDNGVTLTCGGCGNFMGGDDFGVCCRLTYHLKYNYTEACEAYKQKEVTDVSEQEGVY